MVNKQKIVTMTQLALYDKHEGENDRVANDFFRHDYIYRNNLGTRLSVGLGSVILLSLYWLRAIFVEEVDVFELDLQQHLMESVLAVLAVLAVYSLIGTIQGTRKYYLMQKRLTRYQALVRHLERMEERTRSERQAAADELPDSVPLDKRISKPLGAGRIDSSDLVRLPGPERAPIRKPDSERPSFPGRSSNPPKRGDHR